MDGEGQWKGIMVPLGIEDFGSGSNLYYSILTGEHGCLIEFSGTCSVGKQLIERGK